MLSQGHIGAPLNRSTSQVGHRFIEFLVICEVEMMQFHITKPNMEMCKQYCHCLVLMFMLLSFSLHGKHG